MFYLLIYLSAQSIYPYQYLSIYNPIAADLWAGIGLVISKHYLSSRMLENFMGPEEFRIGIKRFLERFKYGNAVTNDLWKELEGVSSKGLDITAIMDTWTRQMGYPVINVRLANCSGISLILVQLKVSFEY